MRPLWFYFVTRLFPIGILVVSMQRSVAANYRVAGVAVQVVLALAAGAGAGAGSERGAFAGFVLGMMYDLGTGVPLGVTALAYGIAGLLAGYVLSITPQPQWWLAALFAAVGAAVGEASVPVIMLITGQEGWLDERLVKVVPIVAAAAFVVAPLFVPLGRWTVGAKKRTWKGVPE